MSVWVQNAALCCPRTAEKRACAMNGGHTHGVPLEMWVKGHLTADAEIGDEVEIITRTGRHVRGRLLEVNPRYTHDYGEFVPELLEIGDTVRGILFGGDGK